MEYDKTTRGGAKPAEIFGVGDSEAKYNVDDVSLIENHGFKKNELRMIESIIEENREIIKERWNEYFNKGAAK